MLSVPNTTDHHVFLCRVSEGVVSFARSLEHSVVNPELLQLKELNDNNRSDTDFKG